MTIESKTTYTFDGVEYLTWGEADNARIAKEKANFNIKDHISPNADVYLEKKLAKHNFPCFIKTVDKYTTSIFLINDAEDVKRVSLGILGERVGTGYWYYDIDNEVSSYIVDTQNGAAAYYFLCDHNDYEYEQFELDTFSHV